MVRGNTTPYTSDSQHDKLQKLYVVSVENLGILHSAGRQQDL